jgi:hypothetical protein
LEPVATTAMVMAMMMMTMMAMVVLVSSLLSTDQPLFARHRKQFAALQVLAPALRSLQSDS